jgi:hypothetical protein
MHDLSPTGPEQVVSRRGVPAWLRASLRWKLLLARWVVGTLAVMTAVAAVPGCRSTATGGSGP